LDALGALLGQVPISVALVILGESTLGFLGLGIRPPTPEWGGMIADGLPTLTISAAGFLVPAVSLGLCVLSLTLLGQALRFLLDQRAA
jgi:peptide/nickel transport system permease protein